MYITLNHIAHRMMKLISFAEKQVMRVVSELDINLYNVIHNIPKGEAMLFNSLIYKYLKLYVLKTENKYQIRMNSNMIPNQSSDDKSNYAYQKIYLKNGKILSYFDKEYVSTIEIEKYKKLKAEMLFVNKLNFSSIIKKYLFSFNITAKELCSVLGQHSSNTVSIIDDSLEEMIFKDTMSMYF